MCLPVFLPLLMTGWLPGRRRARTTAPAVRRTAGADRGADAGPVPAVPAVPASAAPSTVPSPLGSRSPAVVNIRLSSLVRHPAFSPRLAAHVAGGLNRAGIEQLWRGTDELLRQPLSAESRLGCAVLRQELMTAMERRDPAGHAAWLQGLWAAGAAERS